MSEPVKPHVEQPIAPPPGGVPPKPTTLPTPTKAERMKQLSEKLGEILAANGGLESNIPAINHPYWGLKAELDVVRNLPE